MASAAAHDLDQRDASTPYAGDVTCEEAWLELEKNHNAVLIDVRTQPEWVFSGVPVLNKINKKTITLSWKLYPAMEENDGFVASLAQQIPVKDSPLYFICKTGGRSLDAAIAATVAGYARCYNVAHGFEGDKDTHGHRGRLNGWKASGLPWEQA